MSNVKSVNPTGRTDGAQRGRRRRDVMSFKARLKCWDIKIHDSGTFRHAGRQRGWQEGGCQAVRLTGRLAGRQADRLAGTQNYLKSRFQTIDVSE